MRNRLHIAAVGSSFAAGPGIPNIEHEAAGRSSRNYAHQLAKKLDADLADLSVSGATLLDVLDQKQISGDYTFDPQLNHLPANADVVTLTCGGNDLNYIGSLIHQTLLSYVGPDHPAVLGVESNAPALTPQQLKARLLAVLDKIHAIAPQATVYLVQYLPIIGDDTRPLYDVALTAAHLEHFDQVAKMLAQSYYDAARERQGWTTVVPIAEVGRKHGLGARDPWVRGFSLDMLMHGPAPYHPNLAGHTATAEMLYNFIVESRRRKAADGVEVAGC